MKKKIKKQTGKTNLKIDSKRKAKPVGKRISKNGKVYYEYRKNRTDVKGIDLPKKKTLVKLKKKYSSLDKLKKDLISREKANKKELVIVSQYKKNNMKGYLDEYYYIIYSLDKEIDFKFVGKLSNLKINTFSTDDFEKYKFNYVIDGIFSNYKQFQKKGYFFSSKKIREGFEDIKRFHKNK